MRGAGESITFNVTDGAAVVPVTYTGILPDLFAEGEGWWRRVITSTTPSKPLKFFAKHEIEDYMPREVIEAMEAQGVYRPSDAADTGS